MATLVFTHGTTVTAGVQLLIPTVTGEALHGLVVDKGNNIHTVTGKIWQPLNWKQCKPGQSHELHLSMH